MSKPRHRVKQLFELLAEGESECGTRGLVDAFADAGAAQIN